MSDELEKTNEQRIKDEMRAGACELGVDLEVGRIPDELLPQGRTRITLYGEARRIPRVGDRVEVRVEDGGWRAGYRAISEPVDARTIPAEQLEAAGARVEDSVVWITDEHRWQAAPADERASLPGMPWPIEQLKRSEPASE